MSHAANSALRKLLVKAERAWGRRRETVISLLFSQSSHSDYIALSSAADKRACHAVLVHAQHAGAIQIEWDLTAGHQNQIKRVLLQDANKLAALLGVTPRWQAIEEARVILSKWAEKFPIINDVLKAWRNGLRPKSLQPTDALMISDAARTIAHCRAHVSQDVSIRRLSTQLGFDSKHIESLKSAIDLLMSTELNQPAREVEEIFSELGIVKHPLPVLISGPAQVEFEDGSSIKLPAPYVGLSPNSVKSTHVENSCRYVLSVENLTTFHELTQLRSPLILLIYSNGMPSPSWRRFYQRLLTNLPVECRTLHWGDIDGGGFRIAAHIASACHDYQRELKLHMMNPALLPAESKLRPLELREKGEIEQIAQRMGWVAEFEGIASHPYAYEQEALELKLPTD